SKGVPRPTTRSTASAPIRDVHRKPSTRSCGPSTSPACSAEPGAILVAARPRIYDPSMDVRAWLIVMAGLAACHHAEPRGQQTPATPASTPAAAEIEGSDPQNSPTEPELGLMAPIASPAAEQAHGVTQQRLLGKPLDDDPRVQYTPIEDPSGRAL